MHAKNNARKEGLKNHWLVEKRREGQSLLQMDENDCKAPDDMKVCTTRFKDWYTKKCTLEAGWQFARKADVKAACKCRIEKQGLNKKHPSDCEPFNFGTAKKQARYFELLRGQQGVTCKKVLQCTHCQEEKALKLMELDSNENSQEGLDFAAIGFWHFKKNS